MLQSYTPDMTHFSRIVVPIRFRRDDRFWKTQDSSIIQPFLFRVAQTDVKKGSDVSVHS